MPVPKPQAEAGAANASGPGLARHARIHLRVIGPALVFGLGAYAVVKVLLWLTGGLSWL